jgi:hypothetical protein
MTFTLKNEDGKFYLYFIAKGYLKNQVFLFTQTSKVCIPITKLIHGTASSTAAVGMRTQERRRCSLNFTLMPIGLKKYCR